MRLWIVTAIISATFALLVGCETALTSPESTPSENPAPNKSTTDKATTDNAPQIDVSTPRGAMAHQIELLRAGKVEEFRASFTDRQKKKITADAVAAAQKDLENTDLEGLIHEVEEGEWQGNKTAKIKMKNGRSLTTLVMTDGKWLADTVWFR